MKNETLDWGEIWERARKIEYQSLACTITLPEGWSVENCEALTSPDWDGEALIRAIWTTPWGMHYCNLWADEGNWNEKLDDIWQDMVDGIIKKFKRTKGLRKRRTH
jgi:hypothetical protein